MGRLYGTFDPESALGRITELNRYLGDFQILVWFYVLCAILLSLFWPVTWILGLIVGARAWHSQRADLWETSWECFLATGMGLFFCIIPGILLFNTPDGIWGFQELVQKNQLSSNDVQAPWKSEIWFFLLYYFCIMYQDINKQCFLAKAMVQDKMVQDPTALDIHIDERKRMNSVVKDSEVGSRGDLLDLMTLLETMPGWTAPGEEGITEEASGFFSVLEWQEEEAKSKGLWPLDVYSLHQLKYSVAHSRKLAGDIEHGPHMMLQTLSTCWRRIGRTCRYMGNHLKLSKGTIVAVLILTTVRTILPRLWLAYYIQGAFMPEEWIPHIYVCVGSVTLWLCYGAFIALFLVHSADYATNAQEIILLTALINQNARQTYAELVLVKSEGLAPEVSEAILARLPLLDLRKSKNVLAFWELRQYVVLDRSNDRVGMQILMSMGFLITFFNVLLAVYDLMTQTDIPTFVVVVLYDLVVLGMLILYCMQQALHMNTWMSSHQCHFNQAAHDAVSTVALLCIGDARAETTHQAELLDLRLAKQMLKSCSLMVNENDPREALLFGVEVTPAGIISAAGGFLVTGGFFIYAMFKSGENPLEQHHHHVHGDESGESPDVAAAALHAFQHPVETMNYLLAVNSTAAALIRQIL
jgi:hypothetical protein